MTLVKVVYRSVPPASVTSIISSRTARISFPFSAVSRRNSAKLDDMIIVSGVYGFGVRSYPRHLLATLPDSAVDSPSLGLT